MWRCVLVMGWECGTGAGGAGGLMYRGRIATSSSMTTRCEVSSSARGVAGTHKEFLQRNNTVADLDKCSDSEPHRKLGWLGGCWMPRCNRSNQQVRTRSKSTLCSVLAPPQSPHGVHIR